MSTTENTSLSGVSNPGRVMRSLPEMSAGLFASNHLPLVCCVAL
jgi:hypothetical protein